MKDGWHKIKGYEIYVEDNCVMRGIKYDYNNIPVAAYPYKIVKDGYSNTTGVNVSTFRSGNYTMM